MAIIRIPVSLAKLVFSRVTATTLLVIGFFSLVFGTAPKFLGSNLADHTSTVFADAPSCGSCGPSAGCDFNCVWACDVLDSDSLNIGANTSSTCYSGSLSEDCGCATCLGTDQSALGGFGVSGQGGNDSSGSASGSSNGNSTGGPGSDAGVGSGSGPGSSGSDAGTD